jgi:hypothetical protein
MKRPRDYPPSPSALRGRGIEGEGVLRSARASSAFPQTRYRNQCNARAAIVAFDQANAGLLMTRLNRTATTNNPPDR